MRTALYTRVSTQEQVSAGFSLDAQLNRLRAYCDSQGWTVAGVYTDEGASAKNTERPELQRMLEDIKMGKIDVVLVYKLDRFTRSVLDLYELLQTLDKYRVGFKSSTEVFDTTTAMGRLFITIVAALAQWERENLGERTRMGQIEMTKQGRWSGGTPPFGYDYSEGILTINEAQAQVVREIYQRYTSGEGTTKILSWLNDPEHPQLAPNQRWTQWALKYCLRNPIYAGNVRYGYRKASGRRQPDSITEQGIHEPIITPSLWEQADRMRDSRTKMPSRSGTGTYALSGVLHCGLCGSPMSGRTQYRTTKAESPPRRYYACTERQHSGLCKMPNILEVKVEDAVLDVMARYKRKSRPAGEADNSNQEERKKTSITTELNRIAERRQRFLDAFGDGKISAEILSGQLSQLSARESQLKRDLGERKKEIDMEIVMSVLEQFGNTWEVAEVHERKEMVRLVVERIDVSPNGSVNVTFAE